MGNARSSVVNPGSPRTVAHRVPSADVPPVTRSQRTSKRLSIGFPEYGYIVPDGDRVPDEYLVRITSYKNNATVIAPIQEDIQLRIESRWEPFIPTSLLSGINAVVQLATQGERSAITRATTRRLWQGTSPMAISVRLKFEAVTDPFSEVVEPCRLLQAMTAPSEAGGTNWSEIYADIKGVSLANVKDSFTKVASKLPGVRPPGPTPFSMTGILSGQKQYSNMVRSELEQSMSGGDFIMVEFGRFLTFWNVIINTNAVTFKSKFDRSGDPISSEATILFETYEMPTVESIYESYTKFTTSVGN